MAYIQWRRFNFFNKQNVEIPQGGRTWLAVQQQNFTCSACGRGYLVFGDSSGLVHSVNHNFQVVSFRAFDIGVNFLVQLKQHNYLGGVGVDELGINPVIKIWNLEKKDKFGNPFCCRVQATIPSDNNPSKVTAFALHENLSFMAVGFAQGSIVIYKGEVTKDRSSNKVFHLSTDCTDAITGLSFCFLDKINYLFATTSTCVMSFNLNDKIQKKKLLDSHGCPPCCSTMSDAELNNQFVVTASDAVYLYEPDSRGPCFVFEGEKLMSRWFNGFLVLVYKDRAKNSLPSTSSMQLHDKNVVTFYDLKQKLIVFSAPLPGVQEVLFEWGSIFILAANNNLLCLQEIGIHDKLELLFKKNLYSLAVNLARSQDLGKEGLVDIYTQYGDHLYSKADYDTAIMQYIKTIGHLEPSYIIRKFLDAQRIHNLTTYLQALHQQGLANEDHTTLLLNCFTKLKDIDNLNKFILTPDTELHFDVETAIKVCRQAGYCEHALQLAEKHHKHKWYLKIQLEDAHQYERALAYIKKLPFAEAEQSIMQYGRILLEYVSKETTEFIKSLCSGADDISESNNEEHGFTHIQLPTSKSTGDKFLHIFVCAPDMLIDFLEYLIAMQEKASEVVYATLLETYLHKMAQDKENKCSLEKKTLNLLKDFTDKNYDTDHALVLCQTLNFRPGSLYLYEASGLYQQILRYHMDHEAHGLVVETCRRHGDKDVTLWQQALTYFAQRRDVDCRQHITQVLNHIDKHSILPPLIVVQFLSRNSTATLSAVRDYILRRIRQESDVIKEAESSILRYREETDEMKEHINELKCSATIFQETKCDLCSHELELPAVHFLCLHAYHQHCFESYTENEDECPACALKNRKILENLREQEQALASSMALRDQFAAQLRRSADGFSVVADYFAKGFLNQLTLLSDGDKPAAAPLSNRIEPSIEQELKMMQQANMR